MTDSLGLMVTNIFQKAAFLTTRGAHYSNLADGEALAPKSRTGVRFSLRLGQLPALACGYLTCCCSQSLTGVPQDLAVSQSTPVC